MSDTLREFIRLTLGGSHPSEAYDKESVKDPAFNKDSKYVSKKRKKKIKSFLRDLGLSTK